MEHTSWPRNRENSDTAVVGFLPLTLSGGTLWAPMGRTITGGLTFSTWLILIVVPVLYLFYIPDVDNNNG